MNLSDCSARWRGSRGLRSEDISNGTVAICELNQPRTFEMRSSTQFSIILLQKEVLEQAAGYAHAELQPGDVLQDPTLRSLMELLLREKRNSFRSGPLFLDSLATALASYLSQHYAVSLPSKQHFTGGMSVSTLRRCLELMEAHLDRDLRLNELAIEAGVSSSHFLRSFRQSTGKTPHQFLLHRRVERAKALMRTQTTSLTEVALASGFADQHHLARVFHRITGMPPSHYRRSL
jgi:AraC family transcriptional regulator